MLKKYFFITPDSSTRFLIFIIIMMLFAFKILLVFALFYILLLYLFRKKNMNVSDIRAVDPTIALSPCDGTVIKIENKNEKNTMSVRIGMLSHYGIQMPFSGSIRSYTELKQKYFSLGKFTIYRYTTKLELKSRKLGKVWICFNNISTFSRAKIWVRSGDKAEVGAYLGYLPFGGKVVIEFSKDLSILAKENDSLLSAQTLLVSKGKSNV